MRSDSTFEELEFALDIFEGRLADGELVDVEALARACQKFTARGQNFDTSAGGKACGRIGDSVEKSPPRSDRELARIHERLSRAISSVEVSQELIMDEIRDIHHRYRALRGYRCIEPIHSEQYVSICG